MSTSRWGEGEGNLAIELRLELSRHQYTNSGKPSSSEAPDIPS
jgi:hypothetical protein